MTLTKRHKEMCQDFGTCVPTVAQGNIHGLANEQEFVGAIQDSGKMPDGNPRCGVPNPQEQPANSADEVKDLLDSSIWESVFPERSAWD